MNAVVILVAASFITGLVLMVLHGYRRASWILATIGSVLLGILVLFGPLDQPISLGPFSFKLDPEFSFLGRLLVVDETNTAALGYLYLTAAFLFGGGHVARPSRFFYSAGTFAVLAVALSLMVEPFLYAAIFLEVAALAILFVLVDPARPAIRAGLRLLLFYSLGMMAILIAGWMLDTSGVTTGAPLLVERVVRFLAVGFGILLMVPPFHLWIMPAADEADKFSLLFSVVLLYSAGLFVLLRFLNAYEWMRASPVVNESLQVAGIVMVVVGGLWALAQRRLARAAVFLLLADFGATLIMVSIQSPQGYSLALVSSGARVIGIGVWGLGYSLLERVSSEKNRFAGTAYSNPLASAALMVGMFSLAGVPLTAGFPGRWGGLQLVAPQAPVVAWILIFGIAIAVATCMRWMSFLLSSPESSPPTFELLSLERGFLRIGIGICLVLGVFPQLLFPWISQAVIGLQNLIN